MTIVKTAIGAVISTYSTTPNNLISIMTGNITLRATTIIFISEGPMVWILV